MTLRKILADGTVISKISVMNQCGIHYSKRVRTTRMPDTSFCWEPLMGNPDMRLQIINFIIIGNGLCVPNDFQDHNILAERHDEGFFIAQRRVIFMIQLNALLA